MPDGEMVDACVESEVWNGTRESGAIAPAYHIINDDISWEAAFGEEDSLAHVIEYGARVRRYLQDCGALRDVFTPAEGQGA
jgi:exo-beta-1,3-glucanase (GH17 family)